MASVASTSAPFDAVYLSPHLDDVALSCGGQLHRRTSRGERILVVTVFAGAPEPGQPLSSLAEELHGVWNLEENMVHIRRREDVAAGQVLGVQVEHWNFLDALYRLGDDRPLYPELRSLFTELHPHDSALVAALAQRLAERFADLPIIAPLAAGNHVDHQAVRQAVARLGAEAQREAAFYEDFPYARRRRVLSKALGRRKHWQSEIVPLDEPDLEAKVRAIACYESQLVTVWDSNDEMERDLRRFAKKRKGERLWRPRD
jgi:LmbE family N-acetylglucosaminyl deacetylase